MTRKKMSGDGWSFIPAAKASIKETPSGKPFSEQKVILRVEKRSKGKVVTRLSGLNLGKNEIKQLLRECKVAGGGGGTSGESWIEIQGEHVTLIERILHERGCTSIGR